VQKNKVLIPLNGSGYSRTILPYIEKFISPQENKLILFFVTKPPKSLGIAAPDPASGYALKPGGEPVGPEPHPIYASQQEDSIKAHVEADLLPITNQLKDCGYEVSVEIDFSDNTLQDILSVISEHNIDLVAMSTRAHDGVNGFSSAIWPKRFLNNHIYPC
jgi:nucleotide-binding universal stress UspA family protein